APRRRDPVNFVWIAAIAAHGFPLPLQSPVVNQYQKRHCRPFASAHCPFPRRAGYACRDFPPGLWSRARTCRAAASFPSMMLMDFLELLPPPQLFVATLVCGAIIAAIVLIVVRLTLRLLSVPATEVLAVRDGLITSLSAIFALMVAFSAAGIWND